ncbi:hypothetical protein ABZY09_30455 [Streptomyces sp. NPDC002928]|uniref:hypothetical protein n=1 Tax=Streptomyces sp. NPDC002928 TaxID=3154440 RepID=UPI0033BC2B74
MTDTMPEQTTENEQSWGEDSPATYPEFPGNPHNHRFTISFDGRGPMVVVRGNTAAEIIAGFQELEESAAGAAMGNAWASVKAAAAVASGLGATPVPAGAPAAPQAPGMPTPPPFGPNVSVPQAPGFQGNPGFPPPPAPPAPQGGYGQQSGGRAEPKPRPAWPQVYKISIARGDTSFKDYRSANQQYFKGKVQWAGGGDYWIHGEVAQAVAQWNPIPA